MITRRLIVLIVTTLVGIVGTSSAQQGNWADVNGARLYYDQSGAGPDVILIHGFSLDARMWDPQVSALKDHVRITRYDVRGFGRSSAAAQQHDAVANLLGLMDHLEIHEAHIVGMSMGAAIATDFALSHPNRVSSLVLVGATLNGFQHTGWENRFAAMFEAGARGDLLSAKELWLQDPFVTPVHDSDSLRIAATVRDIIMKCPCEQLTDPNLGPGAVTPPAFGRLEELRVPTLAIVGEADDPDMLAIADAVESRATSAQKLLIPDAGHLVNLEQPAVVNRALLSFWDRQN